jgi:membrane-associated phospholipid phosphatase
MLQKISKVISILFHPVLLPSLGLLLLLNSGFYFSAISWEAKRFILLVVLFTTGILPMLSVAILALNPKFDLAMNNKRDRLLPLLFSSVFYYLGYVFLNRMHAIPIFKIFMLASILVIISLLLISIVWKISHHMAAIGGLTATFFALSFRSGLNPVWSILILVLVSGLIGSSRLALNKHNLWQLVAGYSLGFIILYLIVYFI